MRVQGWIQDEGQDTGKWKLTVNEHRYQFQSQETTAEDFKVYV